MRFSSSLHAFHLLPPASASYSAYSSALFNIAQTHRATLFIPVSGAGSSVEDARAADEMAQKTQGRCRTFIQDPETMLDLHDKDRFIALVDKLGLKVPEGKMVESVDEAMEFLLHGSNTNTTLVSKLTSMVASASASASSPEPKYVLKCMGLDENRGDMTLFPLKGDDGELSKTRRALEGLKLRISKGCPYVFQEFIPGQGELIVLVMGQCMLLLCFRKSPCISHTWSMAADLQSTVPTLQSSTATSPLLSPAHPTTCS